MCSASTNLHVELTKDRWLALPFLDSDMKRDDVARKLTEGLPKSVLNAGESARRVLATDYDLVFAEGEDREDTGRLPVARQ